MHAGFEIELVNDLAYSVILILSWATQFQSCCELKCFLHREVFKENISLHDVSTVSGERFGRQRLEIIQKQLATQFCSTIYSYSPAKCVQQCCLSSSWRTHDEMRLPWKSITRHFLENVVLVCKFVLVFPTINFVVKVHERQLDRCLGNFHGGLHEVFWITKVILTILAWFRIVLQNASFSCVVLSIISYPLLQFNLRFINWIPIFIVKQWCNWISF